MGTKQRRSFTSEFAREAVKLAELPGRSLDSCPLPEDRGSARNHTVPNDGSRRRRESSCFGAHDERRPSAARR